MKSGLWAVGAGLLAALLLGFALWPQSAETRPVVAASRDLGAGTVLSPADLEVIQLPTPLPAADLATEPTPLLGRTLAVARFAGETVASRHLGPAVPLAGHERAVAVRVAADAGLAGLLQPGQHVGLVAVVRDRQGQNELGFAKSLIEDLRVLWISPGFRLQPAAYLPETAEDRDLRDPPREGLVVLAASTRPVPILYEAQRTLQVRAIRRALEAEAASAQEGELAATVDPDSLREELPYVIWGVPVEMIAALNHAGSSFTLVLQPPLSEPYATPGFSLEGLLAPLRRLPAADGPQGFAP